MKRLLTIFCIPAVLLLSSTEGWSLPLCRGSNHHSWTNCFGTKTHSIGVKYVGEWKDGKMHGQGTLTLPNGTKYSGGWQNGDMHGHGTYTYSYNDQDFPGWVVTGIWRNSEFLGR